jgi:hypothetical protein
MNVPGALIDVEQPPNQQQITSAAIYCIASAGPKHTYALNHSGDLFFMKNGYDIGWERYKPTYGSQFSAISITKEMFSWNLFAIGKHDKLLYRFNPSKNIMELISPDLDTKIANIAARSKHKLYAVTESGDLLYVNFVKSHKWKKIGYGMKKVTTAKYMNKREVWGIGIDLHPYRYNLAKKTWQRFGIQVLDISAGTENLVLVVNTEGKLLRWDGKDDFIQITGITDIAAVAAYSPEFILVVEKKKGTVMKISLGSSSSCTIS